MRCGAYERASMRSLLEDKCRALALDAEHLVELRQAAGLTSKPAALNAPTGAVEKEEAK